MGEARRKAEAAERPPECTCPLVSVTETPSVNPKCPVHGAGADARAASDRGIRPMPAALPDPPPAAERSETIALTRDAALPNHWNDKPIEPNSFRCPHCGAWRPPYGFNGQRAQMPGTGLVDYVTIYCGKCNVLLQIQILDINAMLAGAGALPAGFDPRRLDRRLRS